MIAWWGWLLIWVGLVLALLIMLAVVAWVLFRKAMVLMKDLSDVVDKTAILDVETEKISKPQIAILAEMAQIRDRHEAQRERRLGLTAARRERRLERGKKITRRDASRMQWPEGWS
ncbi:hypothetical protein ESZ53_02365 [Salinibacterium sp. UTAS2018]|uniref:hypothetical protein n=1 Tax=Salinibacterium sp. UTAS2018 TaxID=2508880 RepID=UPI0010094892|nr:hypothetical protein [Salinibacterium sp. UTAS2018]QAV69385.1 hypothetical protein ESZ53_02365 [Salinibacterium sp. UTAS2018]